MRSSAARVTVTADASDDTAVARVDFFVDGTLAGSDATPPYELAWTTTAARRRRPRARGAASDAAGNVARSADVRVLVDNGRGGPRNAALCAKAKRDGDRFERRTATVHRCVRRRTRSWSCGRHERATRPFRAAARIVDPSAYLTCYAIKGAPGAPRFAPRAVDLADAFGDQRWELRNPVELCLPATRDGSPSRPGARRVHVLPGEGGQGHAALRRADDRRDRRDRHRQPHRSEAEHVLPAGATRRDPARGSCGASRLLPQQAGVGGGAPRRARARRDRRLRHARAHRDEADGVVSARDARHAVAARAAAGDLHLSWPLSDQRRPCFRMR